MDRKGVPRSKCDLTTVNLFKAFGVMKPCFMHQHHHSIAPLDDSQKQRGERKIREREREN